MPNRSYPTNYMPKVTCMVTTSSCTESKNHSYTAYKVIWYTEVYNVLITYDDVSYLEKMP